MTPITEQWLKEHQFKWHQFDRQPDKQWLLWIGRAMGDYTCHEDMGIEVAPGYEGKWYCWLRADSAGRYHRFIHLRHIRFVEELIGIIEGLTGVKWSKELLWYGMMVSQKQADYNKREASRIDKRMQEEQAKLYGWSQAEKDGDRSLVHDHIDAAVKGGHAK